jgi:hypothetical protein
MPRPIRVLDLVGKPVKGVAVDARTVTADGELMYEHTRDTPRPCTLDRVEIKRKPDGKWLYWYWEQSHFGCNYSGVRLDSGRIGDYHLMMPDSFSGTA